MIFFLFLIWQVSAKKDAIDIDYQLYAYKIFIISILSVVHICAYFHTPLNIKQPSCIMLTAPRRCVPTIMWFLYFMFHWKGRVDIFRAKNIGSKLRWNKYVWNKKKMSTMQWKMDHRACTARTSSVQRTFTEDLGELKQVSLISTTN